MNVVKTADSILWGQAVRQFYCTVSIAQVAYSTPGFAQDTKYSSTGYCTCFLYLFFSFLSW